MQRKYIKKLVTKYSRVRVKASSVLNKKIVTAKQVYKLFKDIENETKEKIFVVSLDAGKRILLYDLVAMGFSNCVAVKPKELFVGSILAGADQIIIVHNHPDGDPRPSKEDKEVAEHWCVFGKLFGIDVNDVIIIGEDSYFSFKEKGLIAKYS